eukprot:scaffold72970_cov62-Phaeocystis_antarctica.AAC.1
MLAQRGRAGHHLQPAVQRAGAAHRRVLRLRQPCAASVHACATAAAEGSARCGRSAVPQAGDAELQGAARGEAAARLAPQASRCGRPGGDWHAGISAASARGAAPLRKLRRRSRPRRRAAAGDGAERRRAAGCDFAHHRRHTHGRRRRRGARRRPGPRGPVAAQVPQPERQWHRRRGAGGPRASLAAAARAGDSDSRAQPVRRRGPRRPRGAAAAGRCAVAAEGGAGEAQEARPRGHPDHRRRLRRFGLCARQRLAAGFHHYYQLPLLPDAIQIDTLSTAHV